MPIKPKHLDELLAGCGKPEDLLGEDNPFRQLKKALLERRLGGADAPPRLRVLHRSDRWQGSSPGPWRQALHRCRADCAVAVL